MDPHGGSTSNWARLAGGEESSSRSGGRAGRDGRGERIRTTWIRTADPPATGPVWPEVKNPRAAVAAEREEMVGARGFEPPASCSRSRRATRLRYAPMDPEHTYRPAAPDGLPGAICAEAQIAGIWGWGLCRSGAVRLRGDGDRQVGGPRAIPHPTASGCVQWAADWPWYWPCSWPGRLPVGWSLAATAERRRLHRVTRASRVVGRARVGRRFGALGG